MYVRMDHILLLLLLLLFSVCKQPNFLNQMHYAKQCFYFLKVNETRTTTITNQHKVENNLNNQFQ